MRVARSQVSGIARIDLELTPRRPNARRRTLLWMALLVATLAAAVGTPGGLALPWSAASEAAAPTSDDGALNTALEHTRMRLRLSEAHSRELERQIDTLNQRLRESQEQLSFIRNARNPRNGSN